MSARILQGDCLAVAFFVLYTNQGETGLETIAIFCAVGTFLGIIVFEWWQKRRRG